MPARKNQASASKARMLAVYGKGGMGKSFFATNLVSKLALLGNRVMQLGCDPKHDSCNALFGGISLPTLGDTWRQFKETGREDELAVHDVIFKTPIMNGQTTVFGCEIGGPEVGRGCGGRGITFGFDLLEKFGMSQWALDYIVMDFLGDVVCGGFATPLSRSLAEEVIILCGNDRQSLYAANNIASAAKYFARMGGHTRLLGLVINRDDGSGVAEEFAAQTGLPVLAKIPMDRKIRELADACQLALVEDTFDTIFDTLARQIIAHSTPPVEMKDINPLAYDTFLRVFGTVEPDIEPERAMAEDLFGAPAAPTLGARNGNTSAPSVGVVPETLDIDEPTRLVVTRFSNELGLYVTETDVDPRKGLTLTIDGNFTVCLGSDQELDSKIAILAALQQSGEHYSYVDLRRPASPMYR
jgi:chlorophyllide a reductase subunit X